MAEQEKQPRRRSFRDEAQACVAWELASGNTRFIIFDSVLLWGLVALIYLPFRGLVFSLLLIAGVIMAIANRKGIDTGMVLRILRRRIAGRRRVGYPLG